MPDKALSSFKQAAEKSSFADEVWAWRASQQLPDFDHGSAKQKLQSILESALYCLVTGCATVSMFRNALAR